MNFNLENREKNSGPLVILNDFNNQCDYVNHGMRQFRKFSNRHTSFGK